MSVPTDMVRRVRVYVTSPGRPSLAMALWNTLSCSVPHRRRRPGDPCEVALRGGCHERPHQPGGPGADPRDKSQWAVVGDGLVEPRRALSPMSRSDVVGPATHARSRFAEGVMSVPANLVVRVRIHVTSPGRPSLAIASWNTLSCSVPHRRRQLGDPREATLPGEAS
jgi:hypothetical protein